jgi:hypothetical protein
MLRVAIVLVALTVLAAGCGGSKPAASKHAAPRPVANNPFPQDPQILARTTSPRARRNLAVLASDIHAIKREAPHAKAGSLMGTPRLQRLTTHFLVDLKRSGVDIVSQNRIIDHAAGAAAPVCDQCWQMLEAERPIPAIAGH